MDNFCVLPWFGREISYTGTETHCCLLPRKYDITQIRKEMQEGGRPAACQKCWNLEDQGIRSDRQVKNETLDYYLDRDISFIKQDAIKQGETIKMLKLLTSYTCNAMCVICNPSASSSWNVLAQKMNPLFPINHYQFVDIKRVKQQVDFRNLAALSLIGGEPLYEKNNLDLLEYVLEQGNDRVFLSIVTNGSVRLNSRWKHVLSKFQNINLSVSIDGTEKVFEYTRYPLLWKDLEINLEFFKNITENISSNYTVSNLNVSDHRTSVEWFQSQKINFSINPIYVPAHFSPSALPISVKESISKTFASLAPKHQISLTYSLQDEINYEQFKKEIKQQDHAKGIHMRDYLPELYQLLDLDY